VQIADFPDSEDAAAEAGFAVARGAVENEFYYDLRIAPFSLCDEVRNPGPRHGGESGFVPSPPLAGGRQRQPCAAILRRRNASCERSDRPFGHTSWQPSRLMQPNTPPSSPTSA
jgi:hypothetical protein